MQDDRTARLRWMIPVFMMALGVVLMLIAPGSPTTFDTHPSAAALYTDVNVPPQPATAWTASRDSATSTQQRSAKTVREFKKLTGRPNGWAKHVVDHIIPLCAGGHDSTENMQWQEIEASWRKDVYERALCAALVKQQMIVGAR